MVCVLIEVAGVLRVEPQPVAALAMEAREVRDPALGIAQRD